jgi:hypothetical protein
MQSCISEGTWRAERLWHQPWPEVETDLGADGGVMRRQIETGELKTDLCHAPVAILLETLV